jgi:uncharacterized protein YbjT (DUF2867 family)
VGHHVVDVLAEQGHQVVPMSRTHGVDVITGEGLAAALASLATRPGTAGAGYTEVAGPREESLVEMASLLAARRGYPSNVEGVTDQSDPDHELNVNGALLPGPDAILAGPTFAEWLESAP